MTKSAEVVPDVLAPIGEGLNMVGVQRHAPTELHAKRIRAGVVLDDPLELSPVMVERMTAAAAVIGASTCGIALRDSPPVRRRALQTTRDGRRTHSTGIPRARISASASASDSSRSGRLTTALCVASSRWLSSRLLAAAWLT